MLTAIVTAVTNWLERRRQRTVRLEIDGDVLELSGNPSAGQRMLTEAWLTRHRTTDDLGSNRFALIVAKHNYSDPGLGVLRAPAQDADRLAAVLRDPRIGGFDVRVLLNESAATTNEAIEDFFADRETRSRSRRIVLLLDCCYAGASGRGMVARAGSAISLKEQFGGRGRAVITASSLDELYDWSTSGFSAPRPTRPRANGPSTYKVTCTSPGAPLRSPRRRRCPPNCRKR